MPLDGNIMMVAEAEFAFKFARALPRRANPYTQEEVLDAVESLHPAIEVPDSRYNDFVKVGAPQLIADTACADWFVLGRPTTADWRSRDLVAHAVGAYRNGEKVAAGSGANVLGDPRVALTWLVNELRTYADGISDGQFVTTGTCVVPVPIQRGRPTVVTWPRLRNRVDGLADLVLQHLVDGVKHRIELPRELRQPGKMLEHFARRLAIQRLVRVDAVPGLAWGSQRTVLADACPEFPLDLIERDLAVHGDRLPFTMTAKMSTMAGLMAG